MQHLADPAATMLDVGIVTYLSLKPSDATVWTTAITLQSEYMLLLFMSLPHCPIIGAGTDTGAAIKGNYPELRVFLQKTGVLVS